MKKTILALLSTGFLGLALSFSSSSPAVAQYPVPEWGSSYQPLYGTYRSYYRAPVTSSYIYGSPYYSPYPAPSYTFFGSPVYTRTYYAPAYTTPVPTYTTRYYSQPQPTYYQSWRGLGGVRVMRPVYW
jgi:hypothetical protein